MPKGNVWNFLEGNRGVSLEVLDALADALGMTVKANGNMARQLAATAPKPGRPPVDQPKAKRTR